MPSRGEEMITPMETEKKEVLVIVSKVKELIKDMPGEMRMSGDLPEALSAKVRELLYDAKYRCEANGRKTIKAEDL
jgi:histone H3/H4